MAKHVTLGEGLDSLPVYMRRAHGHDQDWRDGAACRLPNPKMLADVRVVTKMSVEEADPIVRRQVWTTDTLGATHVRILGRKLPAAEVEALATTICNICPAQYDCAIYALRANEEVGTWAMPQVWLEALRERGDRQAEAVIESARSQGLKVQVVVKAVLFDRGNTPE